MDSEGGLFLLEPITVMHMFLSTFKDVPDPRTENTRHDLGDLLVIAFLSVLCGATSCAEMAPSGAKRKAFSVASSSSSTRCRRMTPSRQCSG
ncbi:MAG: transposase family protein [Phaeobacter gallaeciensis]